MRRSDVCWLYEKVNAMLVRSLKFMRGEEGSRDKVWEWGGSICVCVLGGNVRSQLVLEMKQNHTRALLEVVLWLSG